MKDLTNTQAGYLAGLNEQQLDAVTCDADIVFVSAGPGTGKTHMLTSKLVHIVADNQDYQKIVALSYTNTAARQLGDRFYRKLEECGVSKEVSIFNGTIHSYCYRMLKTYYTAFDHIILDDEELWELADDIRKAMKSDVPMDRIIGCLKSESRSMNTQLYDAVSKVKDALKVISIQDILVFFLNALQTDAGFRDWMGDKVTVVAVDEAQDLSELNYRILDAMIDAIPGLKVFLVGDPRQNIFEFNGGSYKNLRDFLDRHPGNVQKTLSITYRCGQAIADYVNTFRFSDCENAQLRSMQQDAGTIQVEVARTEEEEARRVINEIISQGELSKTAIICNSLRYLDVLISMLIEREIPYKVFGGRKLLKRHIRFLNHVLRIVDTENAYSIRKVAQYAGIDISQDGVKKKSLFFASDLGQRIQYLREAAQSLSFEQIARLAISDIVSSPEDDVAVNADFTAFLGITREYASVSEYLTAFATDRESFTQFYESDYVECPFRTDSDALTLSTIHSAKGLEWENVYIMGLCEGNFPNPYFCKAKTPEEEQDFFNTEWKKMYVASTRAKENLYLTYSSSIQRKGYTFTKSPSRFINDRVL